MAGRARAAVLFSKAADAIAPDGATVPYPSLTKDLHHEVELVVALNGGGRFLKAATANDLIWATSSALTLPVATSKSPRDIKRPRETSDFARATSSRKPP